MHRHAARRIGLTVGDEGAAIVGHARVKRGLI
jgi:hypothetical protein